MTKINGNDPAFPTPAYLDKADKSGTRLIVMESDGMSLRTYLIAHAPPVPDDFDPDTGMDGRSNKSKPWSDMTEEEHFKELNSENAQYSMARLIQWPIYWADKILERLKNEKKHNHPTKRNQDA